MWGSESWSEVSRKGSFKLSAMHIFFPLWTSYCASHWCLWWIQHIPATSMFFYTLCGIFFFFKKVQKWECTMTRTYLWCRGTIYTNNLNSVWAQNGRTVTEVHRLLTVILFSPCDLRSLLLFSLARRYQRDTSFSLSSAPLLPCQCINILHLSLSQRILKEVQTQH